MIAQTTLPGFGQADHCEASGTHSPTPLRHVWHHVQPHEAGGPTTSANLVQVCDSCFPYSTLVQGNVQRASRRWYDGYLIEVRLMDGRKLSGTPNHPVLTARGWVSLDLIKEGDYLVTYEGDADSAPEGHVDGKPAMIGEVFDALSVARRMRVPRAGVNFHGERPDSDVDVVSANGQLLPDLQSASGQFSGDGLLPAADTETDALPGLRHADQRFLAARATQAGSVGSDGDGGTFGGAHPCHPQAVSLTATAPRGPVTLKEPFERASADASFGGEPVLGFSGQVTFQPAVSICRFPFADHVYNLQTSTGMYAANGIVVHNCHYSIHRLMWIMAQIALSKPVTDVQRATLTRPPRQAQYALAARGYDACVAAGTLAQIPNEGLALDQ